MAKLSNIIAFNADRLLDNNQTLKIKNVKDETILMTADDLKAVMIEYLTNEMDFFNEGISKKNKLKLEERLNFKLKQFEIAMIRHIDDKLNKITEKIVSTCTDRVINEEVEKRFEEKLKNLKKLL
jgi:hypothetical protein